MRRVFRSVLLDMRVVSAAVSLLLVPVDVSHGQVPWQYNTLCDWSTATLLSIACGQTFAVCVARPDSRKWWSAFGILFFLHVTDFLYAILLQVSWSVGDTFLGHPLGPTSKILGFLFLCVFSAFVIYHYILTSAVRSTLPVWERLLRTFSGLLFGFIGLLLCGHFVPRYSWLWGGADTVIYFGARAIIPYCFWSCIQHPVRPLASYFTTAPRALGGITQRM